MKAKKSNSILGLWGLLAILLIGFAVVAPMLCGQHSAMATLLLALLILIYLVLDGYRRLDTKLEKSAQAQVHHYRQLEALSTLLSTLQPRLPFPTMRGWAASPDLLQKVCALVLENRPQLVVEASSGVSTLVIAYCLQRLGGGKVVSLEHDEKYASITRNLVAAHGLKDFATVVHAPLREHNINGKSWSWYDIAGLPHEGEIDMLVVDGPPEYLHELARYPALPLLHERLSKDAIVLLDDGARPGEKQIVARWQTEYGGLSAEFLELEKGAFLVRRKLT